MVFNVELALPKKHAYWRALEDLPLEAVQYACTEVLKTETFFPVPAILRGYAKDWTRMAKSQQQHSTNEVLALREASLSHEEIAAFIASVWPESRLKDPIPAYDQEAHDGPA